MPTCGYRDPRTAARAVETLVWLIGTGRSYDQRDRDALARTTAYDCGMAVASDSRAAPVASGTLASRPLVHLLVYARNKRLSGRLELRGPDQQEGWIELWRGRIRGTGTTPAVAYFGALAHELGLIDTDTLNATLLEISKTKRLHGEVLVARGSLTAKQRDQLLDEQAARRMTQLFALPSHATFAFYATPPAEEEPAFLVDPVAPAWRGLRDHPPADVAEVLARYAKATLRITNEAPLARAGFDGDEAALCTAVTSRPMTLAQMRVNSVLPRARVELLAYFLVITRCLEPMTTSSPAMPASSPSLRAATALVPDPSGPPASTRAVPAMPRTVFTPGPAGVSPVGLSRPATGPAMLPSMSFRVQPMPATTGSSSNTRLRGAVLLGPADIGAVGIAGRAAAIVTEDLFTVLGLAGGGSVDDARTAYIQLAKLWHPDRLPPDLAPFRSEVATVFARLTEAHATLTDADSRREYVASRAACEGGAEAAPQTRADAIREIDRLLAKRNFAAAEAASRRLSSANAENAEAQALVAWSSTSAGEAPTEKIGLAMPLLERAVRLDRQCTRASYYRGVFRQRLGDAVGALRDFTRVVSIDPQHVDALRELRILEMRARKGSAEHGIGALLTKIRGS